MDPPAPVPGADGLFCQKRKTSTTYCDGKKRVAQDINGAGLVGSYCKLNGTDVFVKKPPISKESGGFFYKKP